MTSDPGSPPEPGSFSFKTANVEQALERIELG
jgi:hypothetical protein